MKTCNMYVLLSPTYIASFERRTHKRDDAACVMKPFDCGLLLSYLKRGLWWSHCSGAIEAKFIRRVHRNVTPFPPSYHHLCQRCVRTPTRPCIHHYIILGRLNIYLRNQTNRNQIAITMEQGCRPTAIRGHRLDRPLNPTRHSRRQSAAFCTIGAPPGSAEYFTPWLITGLTLLAIRVEADDWRGRESFRLRE